ncbi:MFS transporter [Kiloniella laminariae]|uniref:MFS transporter n=1 Tax=Kiloniella laminariae TaxID=454162 RepID=A0ABT4LF23_9PROT|nr:MFS transporter [Kiloniella laminariae]MCZ4279693.1 MFS transporter [Kiloniella laminariae]
MIFFAAAAGAFSRGAFVVAVAWTALVLTNDKAMVGLVLVIWSLIALFVGPFVGTVIERRDHKKSVLAGQLLIVLAIAFPGLVSLFARELAIELAIEQLFIAATLWSIGGLFVGGPFDALVQAVVPRDHRRKVGAQLGSFRQVFMVTGVGVAGLVMHYQGPGIVFLLSAASGLIMWLSVLLLRPLPPARTSGLSVAEADIPETDLPETGNPADATPATDIPANNRRYLSDLREGLGYLAGNPILVVTSITIGLAFASGQVTNTLLPAYVFVEMQSGSDLYGFADAAWAIGAVGASMTVALLVVRYQLQRIESWCLALIGGTMIMMWFEINPVILIGLQLAMGATASTAKAIAEGEFLQHCDETKIGRVRSLVQAITGLIGIFVHLSPSFLTAFSTAQIYLLWGSIFTVTGFLFAFMPATRRSQLVK